MKMFRTMRRRWTTLVAGLVAGGLSLSAGTIAAGLSQAETPKSFGDCVVVVADLKVVSDAYAVHIVDTSHKVRAGKMTWAEGLKSVRTAKDQIRARWSTYDTAAMGDNERVVFETVKATMGSANDASVELAAIMTAQDKAALDHFVVEKLYPAIDPVTTAVSKLIEIKIWQCAYRS